MWPLAGFILLWTEDLSSLLAVGQRLPSVFCHVDLTNLLLASSKQAEKPVESSPRQKSQVFVTQAWK